MFVPASDQDVPAIVALMNRAYRGTAATSGWSTEEAYISGDRITETLLRTDLLTRPEALLLKWIDPVTRAILGCVWLEPAEGSSWYLGSLAIEPGLQNGGLGRELLAAAEQQVRQSGGTRIQMTVINVRDSLIAWYLRRGYQPTGDTKAFPYGDDRFGTPLRDDLSFVVLSKDLAPLAVARDAG